MNIKQLGGKESLEDVSNLGDKMMYDKLVDMKKIKNGIEIAKIHLLKTANILEDLQNKINGGIK
mgnify:FL=1